MNGSEKQINWATEIVAKSIAALEDLRDKNKKYDDDVKKCNTVIDFLKNYDNAAKIINYREKLQNPTLNDLDADPRTFGSVIARIIDGRDLK